LEREEEEVDELDADETASIRTSETLDSDAERSESSSSSGDSLHTSSLEEADSEADDSLAVDDEGSEYDQLEESGSESDGSEDEEDEDDDEDAGSVDLELEEAQEMANAAISVHSRALRVAAAEGLFVKRKKTVMDVVEVVRAIVNTIGPFAVRGYHHIHLDILSPLPSAGGTCERGRDPGTTPLVATAPA
jgi:hypothetical protein